MQRLAARAHRGWKEAQQVRWPAHWMHAPYAWLHTEQLSWNLACSSHTNQPHQEEFNMPRPVTAHKRM